MSRSGYSEDYDSADLAMWRGQVASAIRGRRAQTFLRDLVDALDAMPEKRLITDALRAEAPAFIPPEFASPAMCAIGSLGLKRGIDMSAMDPEDCEAVGDAFGIARQLAAEVVYENDEVWESWSETPEQRWQRMRDWAASKLLPVKP